MKCKICENEVNAILQNFQQCRTCKDIKCNQCITDKKCRRLIKIKSKHNALLTECYCADCYYNKISNPN